MPKGNNSLYGSLGKPRFETLHRKLLEGTSTVTVWCFCAGHLELAGSRQAAETTLHDGHYFEPKKQQNLLKHTRV